VRPTLAGGAAFPALPFIAPAGGARHYGSRPWRHAAMSLDFTVPAGDVPDSGCSLLL